MFQSLSARIMGNVMGSGRTLHQDTAVDSGEWLNLVVEEGSEGTIISTVPISLSQSDTEEDSPEPSDEELVIVPPYTELQVDPYRDQELHQELHQELPVRPKLLFEPLPSIVEDPQESFSGDTHPPSLVHTHTRTPSNDSNPPSLVCTHTRTPSNDSNPPSLVRTHTRTPSNDSRLLLESSPTGSLDSRQRERSRTSSIDSRYRERVRSPSTESRELTGAPFFEQELGPDTPGSHSLELPANLDYCRRYSNGNSECGSGKASSCGFQMGSFSIGSFQGSVVESILFETRKTYRDHGFMAALRYMKGRELDEEMGRSLLHEACTQEIDEFVFNIALMKVDKEMVNYRNERLDNRSPLHVACSYLPLTINEQTRWLVEQQKTKIIKLLSLNSDCTLQDKDGNTVLHLATFHNNTDCVRLILKSSPDCRDIGNNLGNTALHIACRENFLSVVEALLEHKADARLPNKTKKQRCPLHQAIVKGHIKVVEALLSSDPGLVNCPDGKQMLALHLALKHRSPAMALNMLRLQHCPVNTLDSYGRTPLHYASEWGDLEVVGLLLQRDHAHIYLNAQDVNGDTALHLACRHGHQQVSKLLKGRNASKKIINNAGETPKEAAVNAGQLPQRKGVRKLSGLFKKRTSRDYFPTLPLTESLLASTMSTTSVQSSVALGQPV